MGNIGDFVIEDDVLVQYTGNNSEIIIPDCVKNIKYGIFEDNTQITQITFPDHIKDIGRFCGCTALKSIILPHGVEEIRYRAFEGCTSLTDISLPEGVAKIGANAFYNCISLSNVSIPDSVSEIGTSAFGRCASLLNVAVPNGVRVLNSSVFAECSSLEKVTLSENLNELKGYIFEGCTLLTSVIIPDGVKQVDETAFKNTPSLESVTIGVGVESIKEKMFRHCPKLKRVVLLGTPKIEKNTFSDTKIMVIAPRLLEEIGFSRYKERFGIVSAVTTGFEFFDLNSKFVKAAKKNYKDVFAVLVNSKAFALLPLFLSMWQKIEQGVMDDLINIASVGNVPEFLSVLSENKTNTCPTPHIADCAQEQTGKTLSLAEWKQVFALRKADQGYMIKKYKGNEHEVIIPDQIGGQKVVGIDYEAFAKCEGITSIAIPESFRRVNCFAFSGCKALSNVTIPKTVGKIEEFAFYNCTALSRIMLPNSVSKIDEAAFEGCTALSEVTLPRALRTIDARTFQKCSFLKTIEIPQTVKEIGAEAFRECTALVNIIIPDTVTKIGNRAFQDCSVLADIRIPDSIQKIGDYTFCGCNSLKNIVIPDAVTEIGTSAFADCTALENIHIPVGVKKIGSGTFRSTAISMIAIPETVSEIGACAFKGCRALTNISVDENNDVYCSIKGNLYTKDGKTLLLYAPNKNDEVLILPESVTTIAIGAFADTCGYLEKIIFPKNKVHIEDGAFPLFHSIKFVVPLDSAMWKEHVDSIVRKNPQADNQEKPSDEENIPALKYGEYGIRIGYASQSGGMHYLWEDMVFQSLEEAEEWLSFNEPAGCDSIEIIDFVGNIVGGGAY